MRAGAKNFQRRIEQLKAVNRRIHEPGFTCGHESELVLLQLELENLLLFLSVKGVAHALWHTVLNTVNLSYSQVRTLAADLCTACCAVARVAGGEPCRTMW
jgi:hypothetical protein